MPKSIQLKLGNDSYYALPYYPVGSIYISYSSTPPASIYGGDWEQITGRFLLGAGDTYIAGNTGGESAVALNSTDYLYNHVHSFNGARSTSGSSGYSYLVARGRANNEATLTSSSTGGNGSHENMPTYMNVYMWKRTA